MMGHGPTRDANCQEISILRLEQYSSYSYIIRIKFRHQLLKLLVLQKLATNVYEVTNWENIVVVLNIQVIHGTV